MRAKFINEFYEFDNTHEDEYKDNPMTENDKKLIEKAAKLPYMDWMIVEDMENEADTEEARQILHRMARSMYHNEEYSEGNM